MDNSPLKGLSAKTRTRIYELALADQEDVHVDLVDGPKETLPGKTKHSPIHPLQGLPQTCKALRKETLPLCLADKKLICHTRHLERTASGLTSDVEGGRIVYEQELSSLGLVNLLSSVKEIVLDLGVAHSQCKAPAKIEWGAVVNAIRRVCRADAVIKVVVTFDWTMLGAKDRFEMAFEVGKRIRFKPGEIEEAAGRRCGGEAKLPFLSGYMLLRRLVGELQEFEAGEGNRGRS